MNVEQLIAELQKLPKHLPIVVDGYEGGVEELLSVTKVSIKRDIYGGMDKTPWDYGPHHVEPYGADPEELEPAVYLPRQ
jgi:hypothetical protein